VQRQKAALDKFSLAVLVKKLDAAIEEADEAGGAARDAFRDEEIDDVAFVKEMVKQRTLYHKRAAKKERLLRAESMMKVSQ
jgi:hypothetical protein